MRADGRVSLARWRVGRKRVARLGDYGRSCGCRDVLVVHYAEKGSAAPKGGAAKGSRKACEKKSTTSDTAAVGAAVATGDAAAASLTATAPVAAGGSSAAGAQAAPLEAPAIKLTPKYVAKVAIIGIVAGFMSGYVGVGGGFIMVPLFVSMLGIPMRLASGTSLTAVCILAIPGVIEQAVLGNIDYMVGVAMMVGSIPGAIVGANLVKRVPERALRFTFALFLLLMAVLLVVNEASMI